MCDDTARAATELPRTLQAPGLARAFLGDYLCRTHALAIYDEAALLTTEAVTNAVKYGGPPILLVVECDGGGIEVRVADGNPDVPVRTDADELATHGRGVAMIDMVSDSWGVSAHPDDGKDVWFRLRTP